MTQPSTVFRSLTFYEVCVCMNVYSMGVSIWCVCVCVWRGSVFTHTHTHTHTHTPHTHPYTNRAGGRTEAGSETQRKSSRVLVVFCLLVTPRSRGSLCSFSLSSERGEVMAKWQLEETVWRHRPQILDGDISKGWHSGSAVSAVASRQ